MESVKPGDLVGPMMLPASFQKEGALRTSAPQHGVPKRNSRRKGRDLSGRIPLYYYDFQGQ